MRNVVVLMPAYRAGKRVVDTFQRIPQNLVSKVIISDDASPDDTFAQAKTLPDRQAGLPVPVFQNEKNLGYGGNMKVLLQKGLETDGDVFVELHADGQYDPQEVARVLASLRPTDGMLLGSRLLRRGQAREAGMSLLKYVVNIVLTWIANITLGTQLTEFQSGFRVYTRPFLERVNFRANSNDHLFSFETILQALYCEFTVSEIPVVCVYEPGIREMGIRAGIKYTIEMFWTLARYHLARAGRRDPVFQSNRRV